MILAGDSGARLTRGQTIPESYNKSKRIKIPHMNSRGGYVL